MKIEIGMPLYRPSGRLEAVLLALAMQTNKNFYITMYNDTNPDETEEIARDEFIVKRMTDEYGLDITLIQNPHNLGYMKNMRQIFEKATGDILFLLADDDIVSTDCMELCAKAFANEDVGIVSRPYYWFNDNMRAAVRFAGKTYSEIQYIDMDLRKSNIDAIWDCLATAGQLSGLAFRTEYLASGFPFVEDMFTVHIYPFLYLFSKYKCAFMPHSTVAVCSASSQCHTDIYDPSPIEQWINLYKCIIGDSEHSELYIELKKFLMTDYLGLAEIKNYGSFKELINEISVYIKYDKFNLLRPKFWVFSIGSIIVPRKCLIFMVDFYKNHILKKKLENMNVGYEYFPIDIVEKIWTNPEKGERER